MFSIALTLALLASPAHAENLLINPGFESSDSEGMPRPWSLFVMPKEGAAGRLDSAAIRGKSSVMLHTTEAYETEPANNWSQVIITDAASKDIRLTGYIRTENATEAALWLQCFSKSPARVIAAQTSSLRTPLQGTNDWTPVEVKLKAPKETDFLVVRCVLKGKGTAWFDSIQLRFGDKAPVPLEDLEPTEDSADLEGWEEEDLGQDILTISESIQKSIRELESSNSVLLEKIATVQRELKAYRKRALEEEARDRENPLEPLDAYQVRHPLVPHTPYGGSPD